MNIDQSVRSYQFHGLSLRIVCDPLLAPALYARLGCFPRCDDVAPDISFEYAAQASASNALGLMEHAREAARSVYASEMGDVLYLDATDELYITCLDEIHVHCDPTAGQTHAVLRTPRADLAWLISHPLFTLPLIEVLKRRGRFSVHAAGAALGDKGILFPGTSGAGKSTLTLALARAGFAVLGDDMVFLMQRPDGLRALAFPEDVDITDETAGMFADLREMVTAPKAAGWPKRQVALTDNATSQIAWECQPSVLVFPHVAHAAQSVLTPISRSEALMELVPNVLLTSTAASQAHVDALAHLTETCTSYRLETGRDLDVLPRLLGDLIR